MNVIKCPSCGTSIAVAEKKSGMNWAVGCVIAVVAGFVLLSVIGVLAGIAIPSFARARNLAETQGCFNNLRMLEAAKEQAALQHELKPGQPVTEAQVSETLANGFQGLVCRKGGRYSINPVGESPSCSVHGSLPEPMPPTRLPEPER